LLSPEQHGEVTQLAGELGLDHGLARAAGVRPARGERRARRIPGGTPRQPRRRARRG
jgi:hypothetical protein